MMETLTAIRRAGADMIITYYARRRGALLAVTRPHEETDAHTSQKLFARAVQILPGGVDSPVRAFQAVGGAPLFIRRAQRARRSRTWTATGSSTTSCRGGR